MIAEMRIAVFGTGPVGRALAGGLLNRAHSVAVGTRAPDDPAVAARLAGLPGVLIMAHREAAKTAELAIFAIPFDGLSAVAGEITGALPRVSSAALCCGMLAGRPGGGQDELGHLVRMGNQREVAGVDLHCGGVHPFGEEALKLW
jgi:pyrroline-5-carboxylate reductase